uniref:SET domain-containing protein n=1 Tax=Chromera velia CCMP2878 TaxID=1169474 RepID=A0A0G4HKR5_9ALVE|eukprot:Cvel_28517.t1-p1 / transcript=Cvel_28517.t1 / gene=Cvel_28517 / organism=Chromera_velia_CCMP2878 / gene_product=hypothetical protein / transcript_product=hypothetical protein / location=Cvel_scaffold3751:8937-10796(+) / protein_length=620 / sequence_SO=supercontig / SO=protein_coding / is_pseudo=false
MAVYVGDYRSRKGHKALFATKQVERGEVLLEEKTALIPPRRFLEALSLRDLWRNFLQLSDEMRTEILSLYATPVYIRNRCELVNRSAFFEEFPLEIPEEEQETFFLLSRVFQSNAYGDHLYLLTSRANHSCKPNAYRAASFDGVRLWSLKRIEKGEEVTVSFLTEELESLPQSIRTRHLPFHCWCSACVNPLDSARAFVCRRPGCTGHLFALKERDGQTGRLLADCSGCACALPSSSEAELLQREDTAVSRLNGLKQISSASLHQIRTPPRHPNTSIAPPPCASSQTLHLPMGSESQSRSESLPTPGHREPISPTASGSGGSPDASTSQADVWFEKGRTLWEETVAAFGRAHWLTREAAKVAAMFCLRALKAELSLVRRRSTQEHQRERGRIREGGGKRGGGVSSPSCQLHDLHSESLEGGKEKEGQGVSTSTGGPGLHREVCCDEESLLQKGGQGGNSSGGFEDRGGVYELRGRGEGRGDQGDASLSSAFGGQFLTGRLTLWARRRLFFLDLLRQAWEAEAALNGRLCNRNGALVRGLVSDCYRLLGDFSSAKRECEAALSEIRDFFSEEDEPFRFVSVRLRKAEGKDPGWGDEMEEGLVDYGEGFKCQIEASSNDRSL